jgi:hypothetical protein
MPTILRHFRLFLILPFLAIGCARPPNFPEFKGHVVDQVGNPVSDALVKLIRRRDNPLFNAPIDYAMTDGNGDFDFSETDLGNGSKFVIVVSKRDYEPDAQDVSISTSPVKRDAFVLTRAK